MSDQTPYTDPSTPQPAYDDGSAGVAPAPAEQQKPGRNISVGQILAGILLILVVIFIAENTDHVSVRIIAGPKVSAPVFIWLLIAAVVGGLIGALMRARRQHNAKLKARAKQTS